jgi:signal transduction histidine kinase
MIASSLLLFLPLLSVFDFSGNHENIEQNLQRIEIKFLFVSGISTVSVMLFDLIVDFIMKTKSKYKFCRLVISVAYLICCIVPLVSIYRQADIFLVTTHWFYYLSIGATLDFMRSISPEIFSLRKSYCVMFSVFVLSIFRILSYTSTGTDFPILTTILPIFPAIFFLLFVYPIAQWHYSNLRTYKAKDGIVKWLCTLPPGTVSGMFVSSAVIIISALFISAGPITESGHVVFYNFQHITLVSYLKFLMAFVLIFVPGRVFKEEMSGLDAELHLKQAFIRYISHEIRTPVNIINIGIELIEKDVLANRINKDTIINVKDTRATVKNVLRILNDLLAFEKLASSEMQLDLKSVPLVDFVKNLISPFNIKARRGRVNLLAFDPDANDLEYLSSVRIRVDVSKFGQALANLISNGLKVSISSVV